MNRIRISTAAAVAAVGLTFSANADDAHELIEKAMKEGHKGKTSIVAKIKDGSASKADIEKLHGWYKAMAKVKPPKGEVDSWKKKTTRIGGLLGKIAKGDEKAKKAFGKAINCKACHNPHKPD